MINLFMETGLNAASNNKVDAILAEISKLNDEDKALLRIQLQAAYWLKEGIPMLQLKADEGEITLAEINEIKHISRSINA